MLKLLLIGFEDNVDVPLPAMLMSAPGNRVNACDHPAKYELLKQEWRENVGESSI